MRLRPLFLAAALAGCAPRADVVVGPDYDPARIQLVAIAGVADFPGAPGSGEVVADALAKRLPAAGYRFVARRDAPGVDALIFGSVDDYANASERTVMADYPQRDFAPVYGSAASTAGQEDPFPYDDDKTSWVQVPVEQVAPARIALSLALLDAETGETLWTASVERSDDDLAAATRTAVDAIMKAVAAKVRASASAQDAPPFPPPSSANLPPVPVR